jgi:hypothetical protein
VNIRFVLNQMAMCCPANHSMFQLGTCSPTSGRISGQGIYFALFEIEKMTQDGLDFHQNAGNAQIYLYAVGAAELNEKLEMAAG